MKTKTVITSTIINDTAESESPINWAGILIDLHSRDSLTNIAKKLNHNEKTLSNLKSGITREPKFSLGVALLALYGERFPGYHNHLFGDGS